MKRILVIKHCYECNFNYYGTCEKKRGKEIDDAEKFPKWCPLPKVEVKK